MSLYIPKMSDTPGVTIPGLAGNFATIGERLEGLEVEEGEWTPRLSPVPGDIIEYATQDGYYKRIGDVVYIVVVLTLSSVEIGSGANLNIVGLPFPVQSMSALACWINSLATPIEGTVQVYATSNIVAVREQKGGVNHMLRTNDLSDNTNLYISGFYKIGG